MVGNLANVSKNLPNMQSFAMEGYVVFLERVANFFLAKIASFWNFVWIVRNDSKTDFLSALSCLWMTAPMSYLMFWCGHSRDSNGYYYAPASWVPPHYVMPSFPLCEVRVLHPAQCDPTR